MCVRRGAPLSPPASPPLGAERCAPEPHSPLGAEGKVLCPWPFIPLPLPFLACKRAQYACREMAVSVVTEAFPPPPMAAVGGQRMSMGPVDNVASPGIWRYDGSASETTFMTKAPPPSSTFPHAGTWMQMLPQHWTRQAWLGSWKPSWGRRCRGARGRVLWHSSLREGSRLGQEGGRGCHDCCNCLDSLPCPRNHQGGTLLPA